MNATDSVVEPFAHRALLYRGDTEYLDGIVPFIEEGVTAGQPVTLAVPAQRLSLLRTKLGSATDALRMLDMTVVGRNPGRLIGGVLRAATDAHPGCHIRVVTEPIWPSRTAAEYPACVLHEALVNRAITGHRVTTLCPYDANALSETALTDAAMTHPLLIDSHGPRKSDQFAPEAAIAAHTGPLPEPPDAEIHVVTSPDMTGLRQVSAQFAARHGLDRPRTQDLVLALTELASNSLEHAHSPATVLLSATDDHLICQVRDTGHITNPLAGREPASPEELRGRGLLLVHELADLVLIHTVEGSTTVEIQFDTKSTVD